MDRQQLLDARVHVLAAIKASKGEEFTDSYKRFPETFKALHNHEAALEVAATEYLHGLSERAPGYVDWDQVPEPVTLTAASTPIPNKTDDVWKGEAVDLTKAIIDAITLLTTTGAHYGELDTGIDLGVTPLTDWILDAAGTLTADLVSQVTDTNRSLIQKAIKQGIKEGEDRTAMTARIKRYIGNPVRAEIIAQTESVNAYQAGLLNFGIESGAKTKTWEALAGACTICAPLDGETVGIFKQFSNGKDRPSAHPRCRCGVIYNY